MTGSEVEFAYDGPPDYVAAPEPNVRYMPPQPHGGAPGLDVAALVQIGAEAGARRLTSAQVTKLVHLMQTSAMKAQMETFPQIARLLHEAASARIQEIIQQVRSLPAVQMPMPLPGVRGMLGQGVPTGPAYVTLESVLALLTAAQVDQTR